MTCVMCGNENQELKMTTTEEVYRRGDNFLLVYNIPVRECQECGELYYDMKVLDVLERIVDDWEKSLSRMSIVDYQEAA